jgi:HEAT repeat protein
MQHTISNLKQSAEKRLSAIKDLGKSALDPQVIKHLTDLLRDPDQSKRVGTAKDLGQVEGPEARPQAVLLLIEAIAQQDPLVRREAAASLGKIGQGSEPAVAVLTKALKDADSRVRMAAATSLGQIGPTAAEAIPALVTGLADSNLIYCRMAAQSLAQIGAAAVPALIDALHSADKNVRREAAWALGQIGPAAEASVPVLASILQSTGGLSASAPGQARNAEEIATAVVNVKPRCDETQVLSPRATPQSAPDADNKVRQAVAQALERIQGKK